MWITIGHVAYNTEQFDKIMIRGDDVIACVNGSDIILKHGAYFEDAERFYLAILKGIKSGQPIIIL